MLNGGTQISEPWLVLTVRDRDREEKTETKRTGSASETEKCHSHNSEPSHHRLLHVPSLFRAYFVTTYALRERALNMHSTLFVLVCCLHSALFVFGTVKHAFDTICIRHCSCLHMFVSVAVTAGTTTAIDNAEQTLGSSEQKHYVCMYVCVYIYIYIYIHTFRPWQLWEALGFQRYCRNHVHHRSA